ncbi:hypothetical protein ACMFKE_04795 [Staphylococcus haemolyticus]|uniref:hypothetical protein n=1 Tax=Staphylococcus haemolyticus TaxID=1283 RepID=UPI0039BC7E15
MNESRRYRYTEEILNDTKWVTKNGEILEPIAMDEEHIQNTLRLLYKNRDQLWLGCKDFRIIDVYLNGEDFFQKVVRKSTLWRTLIDALDKPTTEFNFEYEGGSLV